MAVPLQNIRMDKFLWSVRLFKTRTIAAEACEKHRVLIDEMPVKSSRAVKIGDILMVKRPPVIHTYEILQLIDKRQPASLVKDYIRDLTPQEELDKAETARMASSGQRDRGTGRPTKKDRRLLDNWQESGL